MVWQVHCNHNRHSSSKCGKGEIQVTHWSTEFLKSIWNIESCLNGLKGLNFPIRAFVSHISFFKKCSMCSQLGSSLSAYFRFPIFIGVSPLTILQLLESHSFLINAWTLTEKTLHVRGSTWLFWFSEILVLWLQEEDFLSWKSLRLLCSLFKALN